jgi:hypothetical protein
MFRAMDAGKDGKLTLEEIKAFMQEARAPAQRQRVGHNHLIAPPLDFVSVQHAKLPSRICPWRMLVLYRKSPRR